MEETTAPVEKKQKKEKKCVVSPFTFTLVLSVVLGCVMIIIPIETFQNEVYAKNLHFDMTSQIFMPQVFKYDSLVFTANNKSGASMYVFKAGTELSPVEGGWAVQYQVEQVIEQGDALVFPVYYVKNTFMSVDALGESGCLLEFHNFGQDEYEDYKPDGTKYVQSAPELGLSNSCKYNTTFNVFGKNYAVLENKGKKAKVNYKISMKSPFYNISSAVPLYECIDSTSCKFEYLPRNYFAVIDLYTVEQSEHATSISLTQQYNERFRWGFPCGIYATLFLLVVFVGCGQLIYNHLSKSKSAASYSSIEDPLDQENPSVN